MINKIELEGRLVATPEIRFTQKMNKVAKFTLACPRTTEKTDFIDVIAWDIPDRKLASMIQDLNLNKGERIIITGKIQKDKNDVNGKVYYNTYILAESVERVFDNNN